VRELLARADRDRLSRRALVQRLSAEETSALFELEERQAAEAADFARPVDELARRPRQDLEAELVDLEIRRQAERALCPDQGCRERADASAARARLDRLERHRAGADARWALLRERLGAALERRERLAERIATATGDPYLLQGARGLLAGSWRAIEEIADELRREQALIAQP
jgi:hypothetical protein